MAQVQGPCDPQFDTIEKLLSKLVASGEECGAAVAVNINGKNVVDIWAGYKDQDHREPWDRDTICNVFSTTKTITSLAGLMAIDRGLVKPTAKVVDIWPEFIDKDEVEVRMLMSHTSGLSGWEDDIDAADIFNVEKSTAMLAKQKPFWKPGTASGYHGVTHGNLVGEIVKLTTGKSLTRFIHEEIAAPLQADFQLGCRDADLHRIANIIPHPEAQIPDLKAGSILAKTMAGALAVSNAADANDPSYRSSEVGGANGYTNARALVKIFSTVSLGSEVDGVCLLKPETIEMIFQDQSFGKDLVMGCTVRFGLGFALTGKDTAFDWLPEGKVCFWYGRGGSIVVMDIERHLTMAYVMNQLGPHGSYLSRTRQYVQAVYAAMGIL